jgi:hypothetical protein
MTKEKIKQLPHKEEGHAGGSVATGRADLGRNVLDLLYLRQI